MQIGKNLNPGQGHERSTLGVRRSKIKVTGAEVVFGSLAETSFIESSKQRHAVSDGNVAVEEKGRECCS